MEKYGIETLERLKERISKKKQITSELPEEKSSMASGLEQKSKKDGYMKTADVNGGNSDGVAFEKDLKKPTVYILGLILHNTGPIWAILANRYAPPSYFTSMFASGMIVLMFYSKSVLDEPITRKMLLGSIILVSGTILLGVENITRGDISISNFNLSLVWLILGVTIVIGALSLQFVGKKKDIFSIAITGGIFGGIMGCMDPIFKGIGQNFGLEGSFFPSNPLGWVIFILSFGFGILTFLISQWAFYRDAPTSIYIPWFNTAYIIYPIMFQLLTLPGYSISYLTYIGVILVVYGIFLIQHKQ